MKRSLKIAIDGFDGAGKSTLIKILREECYNEFLTSVEHLLPITVEIFKKYTNNTNDYLNILSDEFRVVSYLWESFIRLKICEEKYDAKDIVFLIDGYIPI